MQSPERATVLVVDDERGPRTSLRMILEPAHQVLEARSGSEALEILRTHSVDLVTLDLHMPGLGGEEVMRTTRSEFPEVEIIVITGFGSVESAAGSVRAGICDYLTKPFDVVKVGGAVARALAKGRSRRRLTRFLGELGDAVGRDRDANELLADVQRSQKLRGRLVGLFDDHESRGVPGENLATEPLEFLEVLAETLEAKDRYMRGHARRVSVYATLLADRLNLSASDHEQVRIAAFLHDLGKVGVPTDLLVRAGGLDGAERATVEQHPVIGARLVQPLDIAPAIVQAIHHHHEWWDGTGYPDGLAGEDIPLTARIIAVADAFDAMNCDRPYRRALSREVITTEFERFSGSQFDPALAKEFIGLVEAGACDMDLQMMAEVVASTTPRARACA